MRLTWICKDQSALSPEYETSNPLHSDTPSQRTDAPVDKIHFQSQEWDFNP